MRGGRGSLRSNVFAGIALAALLVTTAPPVVGSPPGEPRSVEAEEGYIVDVVDAVDPALAALDVAELFGGRVVHIYDEVIGGFAFRGPKEAADGLRRHPLVEGVQPDLPVRASAERLSTGVRLIRARDGRQATAHDLGVTGRGQRIAVLDTGADLDHPDLRVAQRLGRSCVGGGMDDSEGHGTHVGGIATAIAGNRSHVAGVAPNAELVPVKVLDHRGIGSMSSIICGVNHLTKLKNDGDPTNDVLVANMSFNGRGSPGHCNDGGLREAICRSVQAGIVYAASAGNSDGAVIQEFPGNYHPQVIAVSALTDYNGTLRGDSPCRVLFGRRECDNTLWTRNNSGARIDLTAPGILIVSDARGGGIEVRSGTSQAAPHVAGVAALIRELRPGWGPTKVRNHMLKTGWCPNGQRNDRGGACLGKGAWQNDEDGHAEPLVDARRAVRGLL